MRTLLQGNDLCVGYASRHEGTLLLLLALLLEAVLWKGHPPSLLLPGQLPNLAGVGAVPTVVVTLLCVLAVALRVTAAAYALGAGGGV